MKETLYTGVVVKAIKNKNTFVRHPVVFLYNYQLGNVLGMPSRNHDFWPRIGDWVEFRVHPYCHVDFTKSAPYRLDPDSCRKVESPVKTFVIPSEVVRGKLECVLEIPVTMDEQLNCYSTFAGVILGRSKMRSEMIMIVHRKQSPSKFSWCVYNKSKTSRRHFSTRKKASTVNCSNVKNISISSCDAKCRSSHSDHTSLYEVSSSHVDQSKSPELIEESSRRQLSPEQMSPFLICECAQDPEIVDSITSSNPHAYEQLMDLLIQLGF